VEGFFYGQSSAGPAPLQAMKLGEQQRNG